MSQNELLELFIQNRGQYVSGAFASQELGVSRTAIWKGIRKLEAAGYEFEASTKLGYRLLFHPDKLDEDTIKGLLKTNSFGHPLHYRDELGSTQDAVRAFAEEGAEEGVLVVADSQQSGRGRMGRSWIAPKGKGIWMSLLLRPLVPIHCAPQLTLLAAVALCRSLRRETGLDIGIKWPNDLLIEGKKISGILLESAAEDERLKYIIAGIGISVNMSQNDYPEELLEKATSLRIASGSSFCRAQLMTSFLLEWETLYKLYLDTGFQGIAALWESLSVSLGKRMELTTPQGKLTGVPIGLDSSGAIIVKRDDGEVVTLFSAEMGEPKQA
ncbi:biotin--[acetyl-CoA-carboxylase] ligase [Paenibacillus sp. CAU 1782]